MRNFAFCVAYREWRACGWQAKLSRYLAFCFAFVLVHHAETR